MNTQTSAPPAGSGRKRELGVRGEAVAARYLQLHGCRILARNWRFGRLGELDLVIEDHGTVAAVEVKTRSGLGYGHPLESITRIKVRRLRELLHAWVREQRPGARTLRVDAIGIVLLPGEKPHIDYLRGIA